MERSFIYLKLHLLFTRIVFVLHICFFWRSETFSVTNKQKQRENPQKGKYFFTALKPILAISVCQSSLESEWVQILFDTHQSGPGCGWCWGTGRPTTVTPISPNNRVFHQHGFHTFIINLHPRTPLRSILKLYKYLPLENTEAEHIQHVQRRKTATQTALVCNISSWPTFRPFILKVDQLQQNKWHKNIVQGRNMFKLTFK